MRKLALTLLAITLLAFPTLAQELRLTSSGRQPLPADQAFRFSAAAEPGAVRLSWRIAPGYYLYRDGFEVRADGQPLQLDMPKGVTKDDPTFGVTEVYHDAVSFTVADPRALTVTWQGCQEAGLCYPPVTQELGTSHAAAVSDAASLAGPATAHPDIAQQDGLLERLAARGGVALVLVTFLGFGVLLSLTPCVLPMVPILTGLLLRQGERLTARRGALLSGAYVMSMAAAFGVIGAVAGWSGQNLQMVLQHPAALIGAALIFVALALSSFGAISLRLPMRGTGPSQTRRGTMAGAATLGFGSALIVGPCVTPPLAAALLYVARSGDIALGAAALFCLGLGQGVPLFVAGTFGAGLLPRTGAWMEGVNRLFGLTFLGMAVWVSTRILPGPAVLGVWSAYLVLAGVMLGALDRLDRDTSPARRVGPAVGILAIILGAIMALGAASGAGDPLRPLQRLSAVPEQARLSFRPIDAPAQLKTALAEAPRKPALLYVSADWCVTCRSLERGPLAEPAVTAALSDLTLLKIDVTRTDAASRALLADLDTVGPPTLIFLDPAQREPEGSRLIGAIGAEDILSSVSALRDGHVPERTLQ
ncbi:protein-disulfide reductase DsbD [Frigidibacter sp. MR17.14]|uniref:protein-disulfide reductase DsbD n=1 Tax=Frigidibacter sp. MR17.14 TaxID=3126509 RepID=UPI003012C87F